MFDETLQVFICLWGVLIVIWFFAKMSNIYFDNFKAIYLWIFHEIEFEFYKIILFVFKIKFV